MRTLPAPRARLAIAIAIGIAATIASLPSLARADQANDALFEKGTQAYLHGDFAGAIDAYEQVAAAGVNHQDLHYNLANAYVKADRLGPAAHHYELALGLDPTQEDAQVNLKLVREAAAARWQDKLLGDSREALWVRALREFTPGGLALTFLAVYVALFALALAVYLIPTGFTRVSLAALLVFVALGAAASGGLLAGRWLLQHRVRQAIVLPDELAVKEGPDPGYQTSFLVHASLKLRVIEQEGDWVKIRLANGLEGWTRQRDVGRL